MCSIMGLFAMGTIGLGILTVSGRRRVPKPPAMIIAFIRDDYINCQRVLKELMDRLSSVQKRYVLGVLSSSRGGSSAWSSCTSF